MTLTTDQVAGLAPDAAGAAAGRKLATAKHWESLGRSDSAAWGLCKGSATYQVKADLANFGYHCSCPSRKFPCKHSLGLFFLLSDSQGTFTTGEPPDWMAEWLGRRATKAAKQVEKLETAAAKPVDEKAKQKRAEQREGRVRDGLDRLDLWLCDLVRNGLAGAESKPLEFWDEQARRLVDAQAPGIAARVVRLGDLPALSADWPSRMLAEIGRLSLAIHAARRIDALDGPLAADLRQLIGWNVPTDEVDRDGERVEDDWLLVGQGIDDDGRVRTQRTWAVGSSTGRTALLLQFAAGPQPFGEPFVVGTKQRGTLAFYPGAARQRAKFLSRDGTPEPIADRPPGHGSFREFLDSVADSLAKQPWLTMFGGVIRDVTLVPGDPWHVRDSTGDSVPIFGPNAWRTLALTGGHPADLAGEWAAGLFRPLGVFVEGRLRTT